MPTPPTNLVALEARRERAIALISERYAEGILDDDAIDHRLELAARAQDLAALDALTVDLETPAIATADPPASPATGLATASPTTSLAPLATVRPPRLITILGSRKEQGAWVPAPVTTVVTILGGTELDLREVALARPIELRIRVILGDVTIIAPPGLRVVVSCTPILGDIKIDHEVHEVGPPAAQVTISGVIILGDLKIRYQRPGESWRAAKRRRKLAAKTSPRALPRSLS